jgi:hypothetical protein
LTALLFTFQQVAEAQPGILSGFRYLNLNMGVTGGGSVLLHKTDFKQTPLESLYDFIIDLPATRDLTWEDFLANYDIKDRFLQPRMGVYAQLTYRDWPIKVVGEALSSSSTYTRSSYAVTAGLGKDFYVADSAWYFSFLGGYKYVIKDYGFGASTLVNSIGRKESREDAAQFFGPLNALGRNSGDLCIANVTIAKTLDWYYRWSIGINFFYEVDLTDKLVRSSRMTNYGLMAFVRYKMFGQNPEYNRFYPNPGGGRRK